MAKRHNVSTALGSFDPNSPPLAMASATRSMSLMENAGAIGVIAFISRSPFPGQPRWWGNPDLEDNGDAEPNGDERDTHQDLAGVVEVVFASAVRLLAGDVCP